jgi:hypothetical protein
MSVLRNSRIDDASKMMKAENPAKYNDQFCVIGPD